MILNIIYSPDEAHKSTQLVHQLISNVYRQYDIPVHECSMVKGEQQSEGKSAISTLKVVKRKGVWRYIPNRLTKKIAYLVDAKDAKLAICDGLGVARCMFPVLKVNLNLKLIVVVHGFVKFKPQDLANFNKYSERVKLVFVSASLSNEVQRHYPILSGLCCVIPNTLSPDFSHGLVPRGEARNILGLPVDVELYLAASRLSVKKDVSTVVRAFAKIEDTKKRLVIMGDGPDRMDLERLIDELGIQKSVIWLGWVKGSSRYLKAFDMFVSASTSEGFGLSVLEAYAAGVPVACTEIEPHKKVLGVNGVYFKVGDADDCAEKLLLASFPTIKCDLDEKYQKFSTAYQEIIDF